MEKSDMKRLPFKMAFLPVFVLGLVLSPIFAVAEENGPQVSSVHGFVIIINDLVTVDEKGRLQPHETKRDAELNIQAQVSGNVRVGEDGFWYFKQGQAIEFLKSVMYISNSKTVPLSLEVRPGALKEGEEVKDLPVLIKGSKDEQGAPFKIRINSGMMAGVLLKAER